MSIDFKLKKFLSGFDVEKTHRNTLWLSAFTPTEVARVITFPVDETALFRDTDTDYHTRTFPDGLQNDYLHGYLSEDILVKADRASMAASLEVRSPFLDVALIEFACTLDQSYKLRGRNGKYVLRTLMEPHLPKIATVRKKHGFNIPFGAWAKGPLYTYLRETLMGGSLVQSGLFDQNQLAILLESHKSGQIDNRKKIWALLVLELWMRRWYE
jgi:asparagine synthase (glutamine-hydrolysing)